MNIKVIFVCRQCGAEVIRDYTTLEDPKVFMSRLIKEGDCPAPIKELERYVDKAIDTKALPAPPSRVHECGEKCLGVLHPTMAVW